MSWASWQPSLHQVQVRSWWLPLRGRGGLQRPQCQARGLAHSVRREVHVHRAVYAERTRTPLATLYMREELQKPWPKHVCSTLLQVDRFNRSSEGLVCSSEASRTYVHKRPRKLNYPVGTPYGEVAASGRGVGGTACHTPCHTHLLYLLGMLLY